MNQFTYRSFFKQLLFWTLYLIVWYFIFRVDAENHSLLLRNLMVSFGVGQIIQANLTNYWFIPSFFYKKKYFLFILLIISVSAIAAQASFLAINALPGDINQYTASYNDWIDIFAPVIVVSLFINTVVITVRVSIDRFKNDRLTEQLYKERLATELKFLKAQINPHFLFNSINTVFHLIDQDAEKSKRLLAKFSDILRYHLYQSADEMVPLSTEIEHMQNYLEMEQLRRGDILDIEFKVANDIGYVEIAPLVLLTFIENAFKHVSTHLDKKNWIHISINSVSGWLQVIIENSIKQKPESEEDNELGGIGLANIHKRLEIIYGEKHSIKTAESLKTFKIQLKIEIT
ncbi:MAG: two-component system LytT family sensor kinase [Cyclobacteriaceae bacterium]|jgi:two-component system LytT family sensor kinase